MNAWDIALIASVPMLPVPFTLATLALGRPVAATNVLGLLVQFVFVLGIWALHTRRKVPILPAIGILTGVYCVVGMALARLNPTGDRAFWGAVAGTIMAGVMLIWRLPYRAEPHDRTPLPIWVKLPSIALVITGVVLMKNQLGGFMTVFPMLGLVAAYEARHSLWTLVRRVIAVVAGIASRTVGVAYTICPAKAGLLRGLDGGRSAE